MVSDDSRSLFFAVLAGFFVDWDDDVRRDGKKLESHDARKDDCMCMCVSCFVWSCMQKGCVYYNVRRMPIARWPLFFVVYLLVL